MNSRSISSTQRSQIITSHIIRADSHVFAGTHSPDIYALKSFSAIFKDSAVKFSINDTAQHYNITNGH